MILKKRYKFFKLILVIVGERERERVTEIDLVRERGREIGKEIYLGRERGERKLGREKGRTLGK